MTSWFYGVASGGGGGGGGGKKAQVNLNFFDPTLDFPFIDCSKNNSGFGPRGGTPTVDWYALLNADGYPTAIASGSSNWTLFASCYLLEANSSFTGSVTGTAMTVSGSVTGTALHVGQTVSGTGITAGTRIVSGSGTSWVLSQSMGATGSITITGFIPWVLTWSG